MILAVVGDLPVMGVDDRGAVEEGSIQKFLVELRCTRRLQDF